MATTTQDNGPIRTIEEWRDIETLRVCDANIAEMNQVLATMPAHKRGTRYETDREGALRDMVRMRSIVAARLGL